MNPKIKLLSLIKRAAGPKFGPNLPNNQKANNPAVVKMPLPPRVPQGKGNSGVAPLPLAGQGPPGPAVQKLNKPAPAAPQPAPTPAPKPTPQGAAPGMFGSLGGMLGPIQGMMEGIGVEGAAPYAGFLAPMLKPLVNIAGPMGTAGLTDLLFHRGKNISTLTSGLSNRSGNIPKA